jgi:L-lactate dehydrogenase (cytochrome)
MGKAGVTKCLEIIHKELDITMAFCGHPDIRQVGHDILLPPRSHAPQAFEKLCNLQSHEH